MSASKTKTAAAEKPKSKKPDVADVTAPATEIKMAADAANPAPAEPVSATPQPETAPAVPAAPAALAALKRYPALHPTRIDTAESKRNTWCVYPEAGVSFDAVIQPGFFANVAQQLRIGDRIDVYPEEGGYFAELIVRSTSRMAAIVGVLRHVEFEQMPTATANDFRVEWRGPINKHSVIRIRDGKLLQGGFDTTDLAFGWLGLNARSLAN